MVYIKLGSNLYSRVKDLIKPDLLVECQKHFYLPYPEFKRIAVKHSMELHREIGRHDIITYNDMELMKERERQTPQQIQLISELKSKSEMRKLKLLSSKTSDDYYFQKRPDRSEIKQMTETVSYSMAFIFSFFMAGLTGFYLGSYFLGWEFIDSMMLALAFIFFTIVTETTLFILRQMGKQSKKTKSRPSGPQPRSQSDKRAQGQKDKQQ